MLSLSHIKLREPYYGGEEMEKTEQMQQFSLAFVYAIAAQAGCNHSKPEVDDHSVDLKLLKNMPGHLLEDPELNIQMKSTYQDLKRCEI